MLNYEMTPEEKIVVCLARLDLTEDIIEHINCIVLNEEVDYKLLRQLAVTNQLVPQLAVGVMKTHLDRVCSIEEKKKLISILYVNTLLFARYRNEALRIQKFFDGHDIKCVIIKGLAYHEHVYKNPSLRSVGDFDIVFQEKDMLNAHHLMSELGYKPDKKYEKWSDEDLISYSEVTSHICEYVNGRFEIELHLATQYNNTLFDIEGAFEASIMTAQESIRICNVIDSFFVACVHLWSHFPFSNKILMLGHNTLRLYLDVYESYRVVLQRYNASFVHEMAITRGVDDVVGRVVNEVLRVLDINGELPPYQSSDSRRLFAHKVNGLQIPSEMAVFRRKEIHDLLDQEVKRYLIEEVYPIEHVSKVIHNVDLRYNLTVKDGDASQNITEETLIYRNKVILPQMCTKFGVGVTEEMLIVAIEFDDMSKPWKETLDLSKTYYTILVGKDVEKPPRSLVVQGSDENFSIYIRSEDDTYWIKHPTLLTTAITAVREEENKKQYSLEVPWAEIHLTPYKTGETIYFDLLGHICTADGSMFEICYGAGYCAETGSTLCDCSKLMRFE